MKLMRQKVLPDLAKSRQSAKTVLPDVAKCRQRGSKGFQKVPRGSKPGVVILTKFGNFHSGIETKIWTASERFLEKF